MALTAIVSERGSKGGLYASSDFGVFYTNSDLLEFYPSNSWQIFGTGLPHIASKDMDINYRINKLRISTFGRGVWEHELVCPNVSDLVDNGISYSSGEDFFETQNTITAINHTEILFASKVTYRAGHAVYLHAPFFAHPEPGGKFHAFIHGCNQPGSSFRIGNSTTNDSGTGEPVKADEPEELTNEISLAVIPNPSNGKLSLTLSRSFSGSKRIEIYNVLGERIFRLENLAESQRLDLDLGNHSPGIYFIRASLTGLEGTISILSQKIVIQ